MGYDSDKTHSAVVMRGADSLRLTAASLQEATRRMIEPGARGAIGLADNGGFGIGGANVELATTVWTQLRCSSGESGRDMRCSVAADANCLTLPRLSDVDTGDDLPTVARQLEAPAFPPPQQASLLSWLHSSLAVASSRITVPLAIDLE